MATCPILIARINQEKVNALQHDWWEAFARCHIKKDLASSWLGENDIHSPPTRKLGRGGVTIGNCKGPAAQYLIPL